MALATDNTALVQHLNLLLCAGQMSASTQQKIIRTLTMADMAYNANNEARRLHVARALLLVMSSPDYLIQR